MAFQFKQFSVEDECSTQRVGTDSMLLGAWAAPGNSLRILDIGTGCGVLALMMAQKTNATIDALDIDLPSVDEAIRNFRSSPWPEKLFAFHDSLAHFTSENQPDYDFIITNPPYFVNSLLSASLHKNRARHGQTLSHAELVYLTSCLLAPGGRFTLILPAETTRAFIPLCEKNGLHLHRSMAIHPKPGAPALRLLMEFARSAGDLHEERPLTIRTSSGNYTDEYLALTKSYHNF